MGSHEDELAAMMRARDALLAGIAHDLRNPLNTFAMSTGLLKDDLEQNSLDAGRALGLVKRMERAAQRMQQLIDDLAEASRIESNKVTLVKKEEAIEPLLREAVQAAEPLAADRHATASIDGEIEAGLKASIDHMRMKYALLKATSFVLRSTGERGRVLFSATRDATKAVEIVVRGVNASDVPVSVPAPEEGRGGLALLLLKGIVKLHGGEAVVRNDGSTSVVITLR